jgi:hypothetical protein
LVQEAEGGVPEDRGRARPVEGKPMKKFVFAMITTSFVLVVAEVGCFLVGRYRFPPDDTGRASPTGIPMLLPDPQTIWTYKRNYPIEYDCDSRHVSSSTNSWGLHDEECTPARLGAPQRIMAVGDSFTFGWGVALSSTYWKHLPKLLNEDQEGRAFESGVTSRPL